MYLFFDTETNGLPKNWKAKPQEVDNWPRIIQLAFTVVDVNFNEVYSYSELIKPDGWTIPNEKFWIENGYSTESNILNGVMMFEALHALKNAINTCTHVFAHNMDFDYNIIAAEMIRYGVRADHSPKRVCTMKSTTDFVGAKNARGGQKWPKLEELHEKLFGVKFDNAHDALADVSATVRCARELFRIGLLPM